MSKMGYRSILGKITKNMESDKGTYTIKKSPKALFMESDVII